MARPPSQGRAAVAADVQDLTRILNRIEQDTKRSPRERERLTEILREALSLLLVGKRGGEPVVRKTG